MAEMEHLIVSKKFTYLTFGRDLVYH